MAGSVACLSETVRRGVVTRGGATVTWTDRGCVCFGAEVCYRRPVEHLLQLKQFNGTLLLCNGRLKLLCRG